MDEEYLAAAARYMALNPVRAKTRPQKEELIMVFPDFFEFKETWETICSHTEEGRHETYISNTYVSFSVLVC